MQLERETILLLGYVFVAFEALGLIAAAHAVMTVRTAQGTIAWVIALIFMPVITLILYLIFGRNRCLRYIESKRAADLIMQETLRARNWRPWIEKAQEAEPFSAVEPLKTITRLTNMPLLAGNQVRLLLNGEATFSALFAAIAAARQVVLVQFFTLRDDALGQRLQKVLLGRAAAGVAVYLLYDSIGSRALSKDYSAKLRAGGVKACAFAPRRGLHNRYQLNFCNHRKIAVVDGRVGFIGGHNLGDEYLGLHPPLSPWRDTHLQVTGPILTCLQESFAQDWFWASGEIPPLLVAEDFLKEGMLCQLVTSGPADEQDTCSLFFVSLINCAQKRVWISSPYFVPDEAVFSALRLATLREVDVRILLPLQADHKVVCMASNLYAEEATQAGIKIYHYHPGFVHQKVILVDEQLSAIGSANLDNRSFRLNFEAMLLTQDLDFARAVEEMLLIDFAQATEQLARAFKKISPSARFQMRLARLLSPIL